MKHTVKLFPYALTRIAGRQLTELEKLNLNKTLVILNSIEKIQRDIDQKKEALSEELYTLIATVKDIKQRNTLIQLRRDIYNERFTSLRIHYEKILPVPYAKKVNHYLSLCGKKQTLLKNGERYFEKEKKQSKKILHTLLKKENFQKGLLLSSSILSDNLNKYLTEQKNPLPKIERSLMKYLSRMYTKPSPFSTFTSVALATFSIANSLSPGKQGRKKTSIQLNHYLYHYFYGLLVQNKEIRRHLRIRLNPTIQLSEDQFVFLANNFNRESIQRINQNPALHIISIFLKKRKNWIYDELINQLLTKKFNFS